MLYRRYEDRLKKIARIKLCIYKYRFPILVGITLLLILTGWLTIKKGTIKEDLALSSSAIVYGEEYSVSSKVFMGKADYQFKTEDGEWTDGLPELAGEYSVRLKSRRAFGIYTYGKEKPLSIGKKAFGVSYYTSVIYGETPLKSFSVADGDEVDSYSLTEDRLYAGTSLVGLLTDSVRVKNDRGEDVTFCYDIDYEAKSEITVSKKTLYITTLSDRKVYDGTPLEKHEYSGGNDLCYSDSLTVTYKNFITEVGNVKNALDAVYISDERGEDRTDNYNIRVTEGTLTVDKRPLSVKPIGVKEIYDGKAHGASEYEIVSGSLADGEEISTIDFTGSQTDAGQSASYIDKFVISGEKETTLNYDLSLYSGTLEITPRPIRLADEASKIYDDERITVDTAHTYSEDSLYLVEGHILNLYTDNVTVGEYRAENLAYDIFSEYEDVTRNYSVDISDCVFNIEKRVLTVLTDSDSREYNAEPLTAQSFSVTDGAVIYGQELYPDFSGTITDVGEVANTATFTVIRTYSAEDVTDNYEITVNTGTLTVTPCPVKFTLRGEKIYDGTSNATDLTLEILRESDNVYALFKNHTPNYSPVDADKELPSSDADTYTLCWKLDSITDGNGNNVTGNYLPTFVNGEYIIYRRNLTILTGSDSREYNRLPLYCEDYEIIDGSVAPLQNVVVTDNTQITEIGTEENTLTFIIVQDDVDKTFNYDLQCYEGTLTVTPIILTIGLYQKQVTYNGEEQYFKTDTFYFTKGKLLEGDSITLKAIPSPGIDAGKYSFNGDASACEITYKPGETYVDYYNVTVEGQNQLIIGKAKITVTSKTAEKPYDGTALEVKDFDFTISPIVGGFAERDRDYIEVFCDGVQTEKGSSDNVISGIEIYGNYYQVDYDGAEVESANYIITARFGTLTVT